MGINFFDFFTAKGTSLRESTSIEPFCVTQNWLGGVTSRSVGKKSKESHRGSHRKDMSPLTQGLNYHSACDSELDSGA